MNIKDALEHGRLVLYGKLDNNIDINVLLCSALNCHMAYLHMWPDKSLTNIQKREFKYYLQKRLSGVPVAYIIGKRSFWSLNLKVTKDTLIPREDTEILVTLALGILKSNMTVIDLGTGTGAIALALAIELPNAKILASDCSWLAIKVAKLNSINNNLNKISFIQSNWLASTKDKVFDVVISTPPYITQDDPHLLGGDVRFEPVTALTSGKDGLTDIRIIVEQAYSSLKENGWLLIEHGYHQANAVCNVFSKAGFQHITSHRDYDNNDRIVMGRVGGVN